MGHWVAVGLLDVSQGNGLSAFTVVPNTNDSISATTTNDIGKFMVEGEVGDGRRSIKCDLRSVGVLKVPNVRVRLHLVRSLLEARNGVGNCQLVRSISMPGHLADTSLADICWIPR